MQIENQQFIQVQVMIKREQKCSFSSDGHAVQRVIVDRNLVVFEIRHGMFAFLYFHSQ